MSWSSGDSLNSSNLNLKSSANARIVDDSNFTSIKAAYDDGPSTGVHVIVPPGARTETSRLTLTAGKPLRLTGAGIGATNITWNSIGYFLDVGATDVVDDVTIENCTFTCGSSASGFAQVGRTSEDYDESLFRHRWAFRDLFIVGSGATIDATIGVSLTQLIDYRMDNVL